MFGEGLPVWVNIILFLTGLLIVTKGADKFVDSAAIIAHKTGIHKVMIGVTIVSLGTTLPEFSVALLGGVFNRAPTVMGSTIGSTIVNIGLILSTCIVIRPIVIQRRLYWQHGLFMLLAGLIVLLLSIDGYLNRWDLLILAAGFAGYLYFSIMKFRSARSEDDIPATKAEITGTAITPRYELKMAAVWFILGATGVAFGAILIVQNAVVIATWLGIPELIIGLTVVALGTSLPEYVTGVTSTVKGHGEIALGNVIGANILNIYLVLGIGALSFSRIPLDRQTMVLDYPAMLAIMLVLVTFIFTGKQLVRWRGGVLLAIYAVYLALMFLFFI